MGLLASAVLTWQPCPLVLAASTDAAAGLSGVWWASDYSARLVPVDGGPVPFTAQGRALYADNALGLHKDPGFDKAHALCVPQGIPRVLGAPYPFEIEQSHGQVVFIHEANRAFRIVLLRPTHADPEIWDPSYMGEGIGRWEQGVLVIDTKNFNAKTWLDDSGLPHGAQLHTVERLRTLDGGRELEDLVTIEDPAVFTKPWSARFLFRRAPEVAIVTDWVCGEAHRDVSAVHGAVNYR
jgi:hypothetical protein